MIVHKEVRLDDADGTRFILCHSPDQATRDQARRTADLDRIAERRSEQTWCTIRRQTGRIMQIILAGTVAQSTTLAPAQKAICQAVSVPPPARATAFGPS
ncbi:MULTISPECIES: hypothetical protein [unclassified Frankia]|uniref:hypothetical protein n=1 Tax=unclassified Frankia TaxID=2632575 RepID=UPI0020247E39